MRQSRSYGSVRGAASDDRPYRDPFFGPPRFRVVLSDPNSLTALDTHFPEPYGRLRWIAWRIFVISSFPSEGLSGADAPVIAERTRAERRALLTRGLGFSDIGGWRRLPPFEVCDLEAGMGSHCILLTRESKRRADMLLNVRGSGFGHREAGARREKPRTLRSMSALQAPFTCSFGLNPPMPPSTSCGNSRDGRRSR